MKAKSKAYKAFSLMTALVLLSFGGTSFAAEDFFLYGNQGAANITEVDAPAVGDVQWQNYFTAVDYFRSGAYEGRMIAATGKEIYIQNAVGSGSWTQVAEVNNEMEPSFIKVSPTGDRIALGQGYDKDLLVFNTTVISGGGIVNLNSSSGVTSFSYQDVPYYDVAWVGENHIVINSGSWVVEGKSAISGVGVLDITNAANLPVVVVGYVPGASSGVAVDGNNNLVFGNGYDYDANDDSDTGELRIWPAASWWTGTAPAGTLLSYLGPENYRIGESVLSGAHLGFDAQGNLHVGGGQYVDMDADENGYAALIRNSVMAKALTDQADNLVDETSDEYRTLMPDICGNDSATGILANGRSLTVMWNPTTPVGHEDCVVGSRTDEWGPNVTPKLTTYTISLTSNLDGDAWLDTADNAPNTSSTHNTDTDGDGYGNIIDADFNNDGFVDLADLSELNGVLDTAVTDSEYDMNSDGYVDFLDLGLFNDQLDKKAPYYSF